MERRTLGRTGLAVSALGFGCGSVGGLMVRGAPEEQRRAVARAIEAGVRYFDTAPSYGDGRSEEHLGRVLHDLGRAANDVVVGTKFRVDPALFGQPDSAAAVQRQARESIEASLRRLRRERVDLLQLHTRIVEDQGGQGPDQGGLTPGQVCGPVADALAAIRAAGLTRFAGITAMGDPAAVRRVVTSGLPDTAQVYFNALNPSAGYAGRVDPGGTDFGGLIDAAAGHNVGVINIRPLAAGAVVATAVRHANAGAAGGGAGIGMAGERYPEDVARARALATLAAELGLEGPVELAFRFALAKPGISTVLIGFSDQAQLEDALRWSARGPVDNTAVQQVLALRSPAYGA